MPSVSIDRMRRPGRIEIGLPQQGARHAGRLRQARFELAVVVEDKFAFVFDRHARIVTMATQTIDELPTPSLILDRAILRRNLKRMSDRLRDAGVMLRPHLKTAKSIQVGRMAVEGHDGRITVSTLAEARYFADGGFKDILYGVGIVPAKLPAITELRRQGVNLRVVTDNLTVAKAIAAAATAATRFPSSSRSTAAPAAPACPSRNCRACSTSPRVLHEAPGVDLAGVMTHAGHSYHQSTPDGIAAVAEQERRAIVGAAEALRAAGIPCPIVSGGSTPTAMHSRDFTGITEMRPGVYVFNDLDQEFIGSCGAGDLALSVLASVIGHYPHRNQLLVDAGALALSKDISAQEFQPKVGFGTIAGSADGRPWRWSTARRSTASSARTIPCPTPTCRSARGSASCPITPASPRRPTTATTSSTAISTAASRWSTSTTASTAGERYSEFTVWPPSTVTTLPVMNAPASDASSSSAPSRCSGWPMRRCGMRSIRRWPPGVFQKSLFISVSM